MNVSGRRLCTRVRVPAPHTPLSHRGRSSKRSLLHISRNGLTQISSCALVWGINQPKESPMNTAVAALANFVDVFYDLGWMKRPTGTE